jgi:hypothetical protein
MFFRLKLIGMAFHGFFFTLFSGRVDEKRIAALEKQKQMLIDICKEHGIDPDSAFEPHEKTFLRTLEASNNGASHGALKKIIHDGIEEDRELCLKRKKKGIS